MNTCQKLAAGLALVGDAVTSASFYNSSGEDAGFTLSRPLDAEEQRMLAELGFKDYYEERFPAQTADPARFPPGQFVRAHVCFRQW